MVETQTEVHQVLDTPQIEAEYNRLKDRLLGLSLKYQKCRSDAEDVVSETMVQVLQSKEQFQGRSRLSTWIYTICVHKNLEVLRRKKTTMENLRGYASRIFNRLGTVSFDYTPLSADLQQALDCLDDKERNVFMLTVYEELPQKEIGEILGLSVAHVKVLLHRARKKLMEKLSNYLD